MTNKVDLNILKEKYGVLVQFVNAEDYINAKEVKTIRNNLNMTQTYFASVLGVKKKTIEKWEQGANPITGTAATLLFIIKSKPEVLSYIVKDSSRDFSILESFNSTQKTTVKYESKFVENNINCSEDGDLCYQSLQAA